MDVSVWKRSAMGSWSLLTCRCSGEEHDCCRTPGMAVPTGRDMQRINFADIADIVKDIPDGDVQGKPGYVQRAILVVGDVCRLVVLVVVVTHIVFRKAAGFPSLLLLLCQSRPVDDDGVHRTELPAGWCARAGGGASLRAASLRIHKLRTASLRTAGLGTASLGGAVLGTHGEKQVYSGVDCV